MGTRVDDRLANFGAELNNRLMHLGLDLLFERNLPAFEDLLDVRPQLARFRIDDRELLFDAESKCVLLRAHGGAANVGQKQLAVIPSEGPHRILRSTQVACVVNVFAWAPRSEPVLAFSCDSG